MVKLGEVASFATGGTPNRKNEQFYSGEIPWISGADIFDSGEIQIRRKITEDAVDSSATNIVRAGTLLLVSRTSVGKIAIAPVDLTFSQDITAIFPDEKVITSSFLELLVRYRVASELASKARGVTIKGVSRKDIESLKIPLPPLNEQKRIAEILGGVAESVSKVQWQLQLMENLRNCIFEQQFNEGKRKGSRSSVTIANYIQSTQYGTSKKAGESGRYPILRMGNITYSGIVDMTDLKYIDLADNELEKFTLQDGDILFNRTNSAELVGKTAVFESGADHKVSYAGYLVRARVNANSNPYYVSGYLNSPTGKAQLRLRAKAIVGMANINAKEFLSLEIPSASKTEQDEFAKLSKQCDLTRQLLHQKLTLLQELQRSLSARAFAGQL